MSHTLLLVDDDPNILSGLARVLHKEPYTILTANTAEQAAALLETGPVDVIVTDEEMPGMSGTEFLSRVAAQYPDVIRIVLTGHPSVPAVMRAINEGKVYHFFTKPCNEIDLAITIRHALEQQELTEKTRDLLEVTKQQSSLIGRARLVRRLRESPHDPAPATEGGADGSAEDSAAPMDRRELLDETDAAIKKGRELLTDLEPHTSGQAMCEADPPSAGG